ncbi:hypothetical protein JJB07_05550 [Tumebacillus sp. ITR2]|uniref:Uncharacterized protein n=1 Tax=Tumebacillus amylolyticus TaxID=2801339 RepID=A0ABS1J778_9BACL|nr:hypothetical protein [Tumebacillus amylolyticus]MBL0386114.1 hypothetical protein [Tumebacillus amylolyticus]
MSNPREPEQKRFFFKRKKKSDTRAKVPETLEATEPSAPLIPEVPDTPLEPKPDAEAFLQLAQAVQEQAGALAMANSYDTLRGNKPKVPRWLLLVVAASLLGNLGGGYLVYKYRNIAISKPAVAPVEEAQTEPALTEEQQKMLAQMQEQAQEETVPPVKQVVAWTTEQAEVLPKTERTRIESVLGTIKKQEDFQNGSFNFVFVSGLNQITAMHGGGAVVSAFVNNGYLKSFTPKQIKLTVSYGNQIVLAGTYAQKMPQWAPSDVYLLECAFTADDVRDASILDRLSKSPAEQSKLKFEARIAFDKESKVPGGGPEELWELMNTHLDVPPTPTPIVTATPTKK